MENEKLEIGVRLREIRSIFNGGRRAFIKQFAAELNEPETNIANYENGKASLPNRVLVALYNMGYNPTYILTGEGSRYADNAAGKKLQSGLSASSSVNPTDNEESGGNVIVISNVDLKRFPLEQWIEQASQYPASAGKVKIEIEVGKK